MSELARIISPLTLLLLAACGPKCGVADQASIVDEKDGAFLVHRVTGFQEKLEFFELYREKPRFDLCGKTKTSPVAQEPYERSEGLLKGVQVRGNALQIVLTSKRSEAIDPGKARFLP